MPPRHPDRLVAPWSDEVVAALNAYQEHGVMHPFTCNVSSSHGAGRLLATTAGWKCTDESCDYRQDWAHAFMAQPLS